MKIDVFENGVMRLKEVYNPILVETQEGKRVSFCLRDDVIEVSGDMDFVRLAAQGSERDGQITGWKCWFCNDATGGEFEPEDYCVNDEEFKGENSECEMAFQLKAGGFSKANCPYWRLG